MGFVHYTMTHAIYCYSYIVVLKVGNETKTPFGKSGNIYCWYGHRYSIRHRLETNHVIAFISVEHTYLWWLIPSFVPLVKNN